MARRHIPKDVKEIALRMSQLGVPQDDIEAYTGISKRAIQRLLQTYRGTGEVCRTRVCDGRYRILNTFEANVSLVCSLYSLLRAHYFCSSWKVVLSDDPMLHWKN